jgi:hypothetical protein
LSNPGEHIHGALDIAAPVGTPIYAPEAGVVFPQQSLRNDPTRRWENPVTVDRWPNPFANYFYDAYGGVLVLRSEDAPRTHIIAHSYANQLFNDAWVEADKHYIESPAEERFPLVLWYASPRLVEEGDLIGYVGSAGFSTGPHIHWEIHPRDGWVTYDKRIDPETWT